MWGNPITNKQNSLCTSGQGFECALHTAAKSDKAVLSVDPKGPRERRNCRSVPPTLPAERRPAWLSEMIPNTVKPALCTLRFFERILIAPLESKKERREIRRTGKESTQNILCSYSTFSAQ